MDLNSGLAIAQAHVAEIPVTDLVIKAAEKMGYGQGFLPTQLKFTNQQGQVYHDNNWIAGVYYDEYEEEQAENENGDDNNEDYSDDGNDGNDYKEQQQEIAEVLHGNQKTIDPLTQHSDTTKKMQMDNNLADQQVNNNNKAKTKQQMQQQLSSPLSQVLNTTDLGNFGYCELKVNYLNYD